MPPRNPTEPGPIIVLGEELRCRVCGHDRFWERHAQLNTPFMTFLDLDWMNRTARCYVCDRCGYIHWFLHREE